jgi:tetratricopeptide (TPR) repeat protein
MKPTIFALTIFAAIAIAQDPPKDAAPPDIDALMKSAHSDYMKGDYPSARASLELAWTAIQLSPPAEPKRYDIAKQLESVLAAAGDYKAAQDYEELAINWRENIVGHNDPQLAEEWIELATLCQRLKDYDRAVELFVHARIAHVDHYGHESLQVADDWSRIALVYAAQVEKMEQAIIPLRVAIQTREKVMGAEHPAILPELDRLGSLLVTLHYYSDAEEAFRRALVIRERLTGKMHADLISSIEGLAYAQFGQKKYDEAEAGYKRLLALWISVTQQPDHPMIAMTLDKLAVFYRAQKREDEAVDAANQAIAIRGSFLATALDQEATERKIRGKKDEAAALLDRALAALDLTRPEHVELRKLIQKDIAELNAPPTPEVKPVKPAPARSTTTTKQP